MGAPPPCDVTRFTGRGVRQSHELFPEAARKRAVEVMRLGYLIAWDEERFEGREGREGAAPELADSGAVTRFCAAKGGGALIPLIATATAQRATALCFVVKFSLLA